MDDCQDNRCQNNGTCIDKVGEYECSCIPGFEGTAELLFLCEDSKSLLEFPEILISVKYFD